VRHAGGEYERQRQHPSCKLSHRVILPVAVSQANSLPRLEPEELQGLGGRQALVARAVAEKVTTSAKLAIDDRSARDDALCARK
jgi:hypothetical protein